MAAKDDTIHKHLGIVLDHKAGEIIPKDTEMFYSRNVAGKSDLELSTNSMLLFKNAYEAIKASNGDGISELNWSKETLNVKARQSTVTQEIANASALSEAFKYLSVQSDKTTAALSEQNQSSIKHLVEVEKEFIKAVKDSYKESFAVEVSKKALELMEANILRLNCDIEKKEGENLKLQLELQALREAQAEEHINSLNNLTEQRTLEHRIEDLQREALRIREDIAEEMRTADTEAKDQGKLFILREGFMEQMGTVVQNVSGLKDLWNGVMTATGNADKVMASPVEAAAKTAS